MKLEDFLDDVERWHRGQWPELANPVLSIAKVAEEAGELLGALIKYLEGRGDLSKVYDELGDVFIAAAGAGARLSDVVGDPDRVPAVDVIILDRWKTVSARRYTKPGQEIHVHLSPTPTYEAGFADGLAAGRNGR